jgi:uncharacterized protein (TIGR03437 family)
MRGVNAWDAIKAYIVSGIRTPISPVSKTDPDVVAGRQVFIDAKCQNCHGGPQWSTARVRYTPPPDPSMVSAGQLLAELRNVGTFDANAANEVRANATAPLGAAGFSPAPLLSLFAFSQTFFHNGSVNTLEAVMDNVAHRAAGTGGADRLQNAGQRQQLIRFLLSIDSATVPIAPDPPGALRNTSAASYTGSTVAPDSNVSAFGSGLALQAQGATTLELPFVLGGTTVSVRDSANVLRLARLFYAGPGQVNYLVPGTAARGTATVSVAAVTGTTATGTVEIAPVAPGLFAANGNGQGVAAATAIRVAPDGTQSPVAVFQCGTTAGSCTPAPMNIGSDRIFLTLYGTGIRNRSSLENVRTTIGGTNAPALFAGPQGTFVGLDQVNVEIPASLRGRGEVSIVLNVDGQASNAVTVNVQ